MKEIKICKDCKSEFPNTLDYFGKRSDKKDGLNIRCISCQKKKNQEYYEKTGDHQRQKARDRRKANLELAREKRRKWYRDNMESIKEYNKKYKKENQEKLRDDVKEWVNQHPERAKVYREKRAIKSHKITKEEWIACKDYFDNSCAYCGLKQEEHWIKRKDKIINMELHKEHVDDEGCGDLENCVPACQSCNSEKHTFKLDDWYDCNNSKFSKERYDKIIKWINEDYKKYIC